MKSALGLITDERLRQIAIEGFTHEHDDGEIGGEIASGASCYAAIAGIQSAGVEPEVLEETIDKLRRLDWPFAPDTFKPEDRLRNLVKAGAMILAEIERLQRAAGERSPITAAKADTILRLQDIGHAVEERTPAGFGFLVLVAPFGPAPDARANYISNMNRPSAINVLKEFLLRNGAAEDWMKDIV